MTIGVFASRTGLSVSALRFYASAKLLVPADVDSTSGYRRYAAAQVSDGMLIRDLRLLDMPLSDIARALELTEPRRRELVERHLRRLEAVVRRAHTVARTIGVTSAAKENPMSTTLHTLDLVEALDQVLPAAGTDPELPHLMTVLVEGRDGSVRFVATDSYRLAVRDLVPSQFDGPFTAVVPASTLSDWRAGLTEPAEVAMSLDQRNLELSGPGIDLNALLMPVTFPDYEPFLVPAPNSTRVTIDRQRLLAALERIGCVDRDCAIGITTSEDSLRISHSAHPSQNERLGQSECFGQSEQLEQNQQSADLDARCDGVAQHVVINLRFATDAARNAMGAELIIEIQDPLSPVLFRSADDGTFTSRIMPIKLD